MNAKSLWNRVEVKAGSILEFVGLTSLIPYIDACFQRSGDLPLAVKLHLSSFPDAPTFVMEAIYTSAAVVLNDLDLDILVQSVEGMEWSRSSAYYNLHVERAFNSLFGIDGGRLARYGMLELILPAARDIATELLTTMAMPMPNLKHIDILGLAGIYVEGFPSLPSADTMIMDSILFVSDLNISPACLRHLGIYTYYPMSNLVGLSSFRRLRTLTLRLWGSEFHHRVINEPLISIRLPFLTEIHMYGRYTPLREVDFDLPSLDILKATVMDESSRLPQISPRKIELKLAPNDPSRWRVRDASGVVRDVMMLSSSTQSIAFPYFLKGEIRNVLIDCQSRNAVASLPQLVIISQDGTETVVDERQLAGLMESD